jgi:hypothetical protein
VVCRLGLGAVAHYPEADIARRGIRLGS